MATHSSTLAWKISWTEVPGRLQSLGSQSFRNQLSDLTSLTSYFITGEGNGNPLQYSCLENPMDRGAWAVHGPWGHRESDMTEVAKHACMVLI